MTSITDSVLKIIVWGTGEAAKEFFAYLKKYNAVWLELFDAPCLNICEVWDSAQEKNGTLFLGYKIKYPNVEILKNNDVVCIVAINNYKPIAKQLLNAGYKESVNFDHWNAFCHKLQQSMVADVLTIFKKIDFNLCAGYTVPPYEFEITECASLMNLSCLLDNVQNRGWSEESKDFISDLIVAYAVQQWDRASDKKNSFENLFRSFPKGRLISGMAFYFGGEIERLSNFIHNSEKLVHISRRDIKTIGIYDERFSNGGGQRFLSVIIPLYVNMGYHVVLFTDDYQMTGEYSLPSEVSRVILKNHYGESFTGRLNELSNFVKKYCIDIMCYHHHLGCEQLFYETLFLKLLNVPVIAELHLMFLFLFNNYMGNKLPLMYRMLDKLIVLSRYNEIFWKNLGCNAKYIPNPVEYASIEWDRQIDFRKRKGNVILWIGRIADAGKGALELPEIMKYVHTRCPDVILKIVGKPEGVLLDILRKSIQENGLEQVIQFCGYFTDVRPFYKEADVMLMTSKSEGFPLVLSESKLFGVPTVMYELPYLELVQDGRGYIAVPQGDKEKAADALVKILQNHDLRKQMSIDAKESLQPFVKYDVAGAWKNVFDDFGEPELQKLDTNNPQKMVQELLMQEIWNRS